MVRVPVIRGHGTFGTVQITYSSSDDTAKSGLDYLPSNGILILESGNNMGYINVTILDDSQREFDEQFVLTLTDVSGKFLRRSVQLSLLRNNHIVKLCLNIPTPCASPSKVYHCVNGDGQNGFCTHSARQSTRHHWNNVKL